MREPSLGKRLVTQIHVGLSSRAQAAGLHLELPFLDIWLQVFLHRLLMHTHSEPFPPRWQVQLKIPSHLLTPVLSLEGLGCSYARRNGMGSEL